MALHEHDREDLLGEATTMPIRGLATLSKDELFIGFRPQGQASLYFNADPVFQFDIQFRLRRAFFRGRKLASQSNHMVELNRHSRGGRVVFEQVVIPETDQVEVQETVIETVRLMLAAVKDRDAWQVVGSTIPEFLERVQSFGNHILAGPIRLAPQANA